MSLVLHKLTTGRRLELVVPDDQYFGEAGHEGEAVDDLEECLEPVVGQHDGREAHVLGGDDGQEERVKHTRLKYIQT